MKDIAPCAAFSRHRSALRHAAALMAIAHEPYMRARRASLLELPRTSEVMASASRAARSKHFTKYFEKCGRAAGPQGVR
jgi:hypothetical protein